MPGGAVAAAPCALAQQRGLGELDEGLAGAAGVEPVADVSLGREARQAQDGGRHVAAAEGCDDGCGVLFADRIVVRDGDDAHMTESDRRSRRATCRRPAGEVVARRPSPSSRSTSFSPSTTKTSRALGRLEQLREPIKHHGDALGRPSAVGSALAEVLRVAQPHDVEGVAAVRVLVAVRGDDAVGETGLARGRLGVAVLFEPAHGAVAVGDVELAADEIEHAAALALLVVVPDALDRG